jgi:SAM-dependent methyltransferase
MTSTNADQNAYWNGPAGGRWVAEQEELDRALRPFGDAALAAAAPRPGERVLDVGCGCGATTIDLARQVTATGAVTGIDISTQMLDRARSRVAALGLKSVGFLEADAGAHPFASEYDLVFSRYGVMFFADPARAFANLTHALVPGGRVAFVAWRSLEENAWLDVPFRAALTVVEPPPPEPPDAPGPFAFASDARVMQILADAGLARVVVAPFEHALLLGTSVDAAVQFACSTGRVARMLQSDEARRPRVLEAVRAALAATATEKGVALPGAAWIVTASRT